MLAPAIVIITLALVFYSIGIWAERILRFPLFHGHSGWGSARTV